MIKTTTCPLCGNDDLQLLSEENEFSLLKCLKCSLVFKSLEESLAEHIGNMPDRLYNDVRIRRRDKSNIQRAGYRLNTLSRYKKQGKLLEIGCATGEFLEAARQWGFDVSGLDASQVYAEYALRKGLNVRCGRLEDLDYAQEEFDVVCMFHLIEHIQYPKEFLKQVHGYLKTGGLLYIITPNLESRTDKLFKYKHPNFAQADHLFFYSKDVLGKLLSVSGFERGGVYSKEYVHHIITSFIQLLASRLKRSSLKSQSHLCDKRNSEPLKGQAKVNPFIKGIVYKISFFVAYLFYIVLKPYGLILDRYGKGHELIIIAEKRLW